MSSAARSSRCESVRRARASSSSSSSDARGEQVARIGHRRSGADLREPLLLARDALGDHLAQPVARPRHAVGLLGHVGHDELGGVGGRRRAHVGDEVEQRLVGFVPDRGDDGGAHRVHRADQRLVGEGEQVLDGAAAARDDDDVDVRVPLEPVERLHHLGGRPRALHRGVGHLELHGRPAAPGVLQDVALGRAVGRGDQADAAGQEGQVALELGGEEALGGQQLASALEPGQQLAEAHHPDLARGEGEGPAVGVEARPRVDHDAGALDEGRVHRVEERRWRR